MANDAQVPGGLPQVGVEEEFLLVDARSGRPAARIAQVIDGAQARAGDLAQKELHRSQIEIASRPSSRLDELAAQLDTLRQQVAAAAREQGALVVASGSFPAEMGAEGRQITAGERYATIAEEAGMLADEQLICGCHVHVTTTSTDVAVAVMNRVRRWAPLLSALAANSPYWEGRDTGYASFRTEVWSRWPTAGPPGEFGSAADYHDLVDRLVRSGAILDRAMIYWDIRPSDHFPTLEFRFADVSLTVDDAVTIAGLCRALVVRSSMDDGPAPPLRHELLRAASWRAAKSGLGDDLIDPLDGSARPAAAALDELRCYLEPALDRLGEGEEITRLLDGLLARGNGADRQRAAFARNADLADVIDLATI